jgi:HEAT repeat protein
MKNVNKVVAILEAIAEGDGEVNIPEAIEGALQLLKPVSEAIGMAPATLNATLSEDEMDTIVDASIRTAMQYLDPDEE